MQALLADHLERLPDIISTFDVKHGLLHVVAVFVCFVVVCLFVFYFYFRDSNMISIGATEFRYYVVIIKLVNLGKA